MRGLTVCWKHGGASAPARAKGARVVAEHRSRKLVALELASFGDVADVHPLDALLGAVGTAAGMCSGLQELVAGLAPGFGSTPGEDGAPARAGIAGPDHLGDGRPHVYVSMLREWTSELGRLSKLALDAGIDERRVRMAELEGEVLARVVRATADAAAAGGVEAGMAAAAAAIRAAGRGAITVGSGSGRPRAGG